MTTKKIILTCLVCLSTIVVFAQEKNDSLAYQLQRQKINNMLDQRALKFGQYQESLGKRTGIFGLQTKKDIRRSDDILMDIVKTDNAIYRELKILFDYTIFQRTQVQSHSKEAEKSNLGYMTTINRLRAQVDQLKADAAKQQQGQEKTRLQFIIALGLMFILTLFLLTRTRKRSA